MSCGLGRHFIINSPSFSLSIVPSLPPFLHPLWFNLSGGKGRVSMEMNMNVVIMCDWECTADGCQDNMGASHPSRLVDEQEKSAELQWCMGCTGGTGRGEPLLSTPAFASVASLQPLTISRTSAEEGAVFSPRIVWSLVVSSDHLTHFYFFTLPLKITRVYSHLFIFICTYSSPLCSGRIKNKSAHQYLYIHSIGFMRAL